MVRPFPHGKAPKSPTPPPLKSNGSSVAPRKSPPKPGRPFARGPSVGQTSCLRRNDFGSVLFNSLSVANSLRLVLNRELNYRRTVCSVRFREELDRDDLENSARFNERFARLGDNPASLSD